MRGTTDQCKDMKIDVDRLIDSMQERLTTVTSNGGPPSSNLWRIGRVPAHVRDIDSAAYDPKFVSIGPLHRGRDRLQAAERLKWQHLHRLLLRNKDNRQPERYNAALTGYVKVIEEQEQGLRGQYAEDTSRVCSRQFVEMMVLDGCFIIDLLINYSGIRKKEKSLFANDWTPSLIRMDLLLLENQIPFSVLQSLFGCSIVDDFKDPQYNKSQKDIDLMMLAVHYLTEGKIKNADRLRGTIGFVHHLLHLLHLSLCPDEPPVGCMPRTLRKLRQLALRMLYIPLSPCTYLMSRGRRSHVLENRMPSASMLQGVWVHFKKKDWWQFPCVTFEDGLLNMPPLVIEDVTKPKLQNLIALEQSMPEFESGNLFSSYAWFMDNLIDTASDVRILREKGIIQSNLGSDKQVATYFNKLCRGQHLDYKKHYFRHIADDLNNYHLDPRNRWCARLMQDYCTDPWKVIALLWAIATLVLSALQTFHSSPAK